MAEEDGLGSMFEEPSGYFQAEKPHTFADYTTKSGEKLTLRLVGHSPLWVCREALDSVYNELMVCTWQDGS